ncbi:hypothetical protein C8Q76DRAFT_716330 [Earliella scabrosa]|nr:hypothetical protein C8Q76DRAFT_716330 [Earliella scabrosa]
MAKPKLADGNTSTSGSRTTAAAAPFDRGVTDVILRTADNVDFHVWKAILLEASPVWSDMFELRGSTQNKGGVSDGAVDPTTPPIVPIPESSVVLDPLLRTCYPPPHSSFSSLDSLTPVLAAAHKYQMDGVLQYLTAGLLTHARAAPLRVYIVAMRFDLHEASAVAARHFLAHLPADEYVLELEDFSAGSYHRLLAYRKKCIQALSEMIESKLSWLPDSVWQPVLSCTACQGESFSTTLRGSDIQRTPRRWLWQHYQRMGAILAERPCRAAIEDPRLTDRAVREASGCGNCRMSVHDGLQAFTAHLMDEIDRRIAEIPLPSQ